MAHLILFDIDLTLVRTDHAGRGSIAAAFAKTFGIEGAVDGMQIDGRTDHAIFSELVSTHRVRPDDPDGAVAELAAAYLAELGPALASREGTVLPGVPALLDALKASHGAVGLATGNMRRGAELKLGHFGLWDHFAAGGFGDATSVRSEVVTTAVSCLAEVLGVDADPGDAVVFGDTPRDVEAAHHADVRAIGVATGRYSEAELRASGAEWVLPDLSDTRRVLDILGN